MNGVENVNIEHLEELADSLIESHDALLRALVDLRKKHHLTQETVAERMGVSQPTVAAFERYDANPKLSTIRRYALAVGASIRHEVEDRCCATTVEAFRSVVTPPKVQRWEPEVGFAWEWIPGPVVAKVVVHA